MNSRSFRPNSRLFEWNWTHEFSLIKVSHCAIDTLLEINSRKFCDHIYDSVRARRVLAIINQFSILLLVVFIPFAFLHNSSVYNSTFVQRKVYSSISFSFSRMCVCVLFFSLLMHCFSIDECKGLVAATAAAVATRTDASQHCRLRHAQQNSNNKNSQQLVILKSKTIHYIFWKQQMKPNGMKIKLENKYFRI